MSDSGPPPREERTRLAEGSVGGWGWALDAWPASGDKADMFRAAVTRAGGDPSGLAVEYAVVDSDGSLTDVRSPFGGRPNPRESVGFGYVAGASAFGSLRPLFFCAPETDASVLCGPVARGVDDVVVSAGLRPLVREEIVGERPPEMLSPRRARLVGDGSPVGRFFVADFAEPVFWINVVAEPHDSVGDAVRQVTNSCLITRRHLADAVLIGSGTAPNGGEWWLRAWTPTEEGVGGFRTVEYRWPAGSGWDGGLAGAWGLASDRAGGHLVRVEHPGVDGPIIGEAIDPVDAVDVRLVDGTRLPAQMIRTEMIAESWWIAFPPEDLRPMKVDALDRDGAVLETIPA